MTTPDKKSWLSYANLSDAYERKARLAPALISLAMLLPAAIAFGLELGDWLSVVVTGVGLGAAIALGLSQLASAMGNRLQNKLWPRWPHDSPTNVWLHPGDASRSQQQKEQWYAAIKRLTGLDIQAESETGALEACINDAVSQLRNRLWKSNVAERLAIHNADFGFARNFCGMYLVWLPATILAAVSCWIGVKFTLANFGWSIGASIVAVVAILLAVSVLRPFVKQKAQQYADSFFSAVLALNEQSKSEADRKS